MDSPNMNDDDQQQQQSGFEKPTVAQFFLVPLALLERAKPYVEQVRSAARATLAFLGMVWQEGSARLGDYVTNLTPSQRTIFALGAVTFLLVLACGYCVNTLVSMPTLALAPTSTSALRGNSGTQAPAFKATNTAGPTATPGPTSTPVPTNTQKPTPTSTPKPSPAQVLTALLKSALEHDGRLTDGLKVGYEIGDENLDVQTKAEDHLIGDWIKVEIQEDAKTILRTLYTQWPASLGAKPAQVTFQAMGPTTDKYGNESTGAWGRAILYRSTAAKINWNNLTYRQCWDVYDYTYWIDGL
jgi:hypothetical protein